MWTPLQRIIDMQIGKVTRRSAKKAGRWTTGKARKRKEGKKGEIMSMMAKRKQGKKEMNMGMGGNRKTWLGIGGGVLGSVAGLATWFAMKSKSSNKSRWARSGQAPGRSHIQMSSHKSAQSRFQPKGRKFGRT